MRLRWIVRTALLYPLVLLASQPAAAQVGVEMVPAETDSSNQAAWWRPVVVKGNTTYVAFNSPGDTAGTHRIKIGVKVGTGNWTIGFLKDENGNVWSHEDDVGHDQPTIAVDGDGYIHVWADHHVDDWRYFRSGAPNDPTAMLRRIGSMPGTVGATYPIAEHAPNGDIYLIIRNHFSGAGQGELYRWNNTADSWSKMGIFARENTNFVYPDDLKIDDAGNVHIAFEWAYGTPRALRHYGSYLKYDVAAGVFRTANGTALSAPATRATPNLLFQGLGSGEVWNNSNDGVGIQAAGLTVDQYARPSIAYRYRTAGGSNALNYDVYRIRWNGSAWSDKVKIYTASNNVPAAVETTHNGTRARVYFTVSGVGLMAAESPGWAVRPVATGQPGVSRISGILTGITQDVIYAAAPTQIDANRGRVYIMTIGDVLP